MRAVRIEGGRPVVVERPDPDPSAGEAVIRVLLAGICGTDLEIAQGYMAHPGVLGHEFVGVVEDAPDRAWIGRRVVGEINVPCGTCPTCGAGLGRHCPTRSVLGILGRDGAFAEKVALPVANLHEVPASIADEAAVLVEPLAAAHEILAQVPLSRGARVLVLGDGRLGQLAAQAIARAGTFPTVVGRHPAKLERLARRGFLTELESASPGRDFDVVIEATGSPAGLERALAVVRPRGTVVLKSTYHGKPPLALAGIVIDEVTVVGSRCGSFEPALAHLASDPTLHSDFVSARYALDRVGDAFARAASSDALKVLLAP